MFKCTHFPVIGMIFSLFWVMFLPNLSFVVTIFILAASLLLFSWPVVSSTGHLLFPCALGMPVVINPWLDFVSFLNDNKYLTGEENPFTLAVSVDWLFWNGTQGLLKAVNGSYPWSVCNSSPHSQHHTWDFCSILLSTFLLCLDSFVFFPDWLFFFLNPFEGPHWSSLLAFALSNTD